MEILRDRREEFDQVGVKVLGISRDSPWTHISWMQALDLNFGLLSDWNAEAVQGFGVSREFRGFKVRATWSYEDSEVPNFDDLIAAAQAL
jgi:peroxiredoxin